MSRPALLELIVRGDFEQTRQVLPAEPKIDRATATAVGRLRREMASAPGGESSAYWEGELSEGHWDAVTVAHLASLPASKAAGVSSVSRRAASTLPEIFQGELASIVEGWASLYQRNPRNWDRNGHYPVMFEWVGRGLIPAPVHDGAVNLWLEFATRIVHPLSPPEAGEPQDWTVPTPQSCPALYVVTLPLLFQAAVKPGLGAAALDHQSGGQVQDLVCHLVESGVWDHTETVSRLETARLLPDRANAFQQRWLKQLEQRLAALA